MTLCLVHIGPTTPPDFSMGGLACRRHCIFSNKPHFLSDQRRQQKPDGLSRLMIVFNDPKMDAAYLWTSSTKPQGGAEAQEMLLKLAGVSCFEEAKREGKDPLSQVAE